VVDKKALKILTSTYWSSARWKPESEHITPPDDLRYAKQAGVMFDSIRVSHGDIVRRAIEIRSMIDPNIITNAFPRPSWVSAMNTTKSSKPRRKPLKRRKRRRSLPGPSTSRSPTRWATSSTKFFCP
jgi:hypothetical protein